MKDTRYLWRELCLFFALAALFAWKTGEHFVWVQVLLGVTAAYLIARVVHAEPIPGNIQTHLSPRPPFEARITIEQAPRKFAIPKRDLTQISIPLDVTGIPTGTEVKVDGLAVTIEGFDGRQFKGFSRPSQATNASQL